MTRTMNAARVWLGVAGWVGLAFAVLLDLHALWCGIRRNVRGTGPSGIPVISLLVYVVICQYRQRLLDLAWFVLFYALCHFVIPFLHARLLSRR